VIDEILVNMAIEGPRIALLEEGVLQEVILDPPHRPLILGNIYLGRVQRVLPGMQAAFIDIGEGRAAFMGAREARTLAGGDAARSDDYDAPLPPISQCVHEGQPILVQVIKDPVRDKGARVTAGVGLAGRNLVFVPSRETDAFSRRITDDEAKERLAGMMARLRADGVIAADGAFILRTAALTASEQEIGDDAAALQRVWQKFPNPNSGNEKVPSLFHQDQSPVVRALRDNLNKGVTRVVFDDGQVLSEAKSYVSRVMPALVDRLSLHTGPGLLFDQHQVDTEIDTVLEARVSLPAGGWITVEATEALTVIDVNSGSFVDPHGLENTSLVTNLEAVTETARQLRLRRVGGIVIIDLIHMEQPESAEAVLERLASCLAKDRTPTQVLGISELGLVQMTRKRVGDTLARGLSDPCAICGERDHVKSVAAIAHDVLRAVEREARSGPMSGIVASVSSEVADYFDRAGADLVKRAGERAGQPVLVRRANYPRDRFEIASQVRAQKDLEL
jgi:ribonuclease G